MKQNGLRAFLLELVYGGHISSVTVLSLALTGFLLLGIQVSLVLLAIHYCMSQVVYSYNRYKEINYDAESNPERTKHLRGKFRWAALSPWLYVAALISLLSLTNLRVSLLVGFLVVGGILYTDYLKENLTKIIPGFKNVYTSLFLALSVFSLPLFLGQAITPFYLHLSLFVFIRMCINTVFCDIKDIKSDADRNLKTVPVLLGKNNTLYLLHVANLASLLILVSSISQGILPQTALALGFSVAYDFAYLTLAFFWEGKSLRNLSYVVADLEFWFWPSLVLAARLIR